MDELVLKSNKNALFELKLQLVINYEYGKEDIFCRVVLTNLTNNQKQGNIFDPRKFHDALSYYAQQEAMFIKM